MEHTLHPQYRKPGPPPGSPQLEIIPSPPPKKQKAFKINRIGLILVPLFLSTINNSFLLKEIYKKLSI